jgi:hypothetical protein
MRLLCKDASQTLLLFIGSGFVHHKPFVTHKSTATGLVLQNLALRAHQARGAKARLSAQNQFMPSFPIPVRNPGWSARLDTGRPCALQHGFT